MKSLLTIVEANSASIDKCFERMHQSQIRESVPNSNEFGRIMGHIISSRNGLIGLMGRKQVKPVLPIRLDWGDFGKFDEESAFDPYNEMPTLESMAEKHEACKDALMLAIMDIPAPIFNQPVSFPIPLISNQTIGGFIAFMLFHESYHIGQMSMIVKSTTGNSLFSEEMKQE